MKETLMKLGVVVLIVWLVFAGWQTCLGQVFPAVVGPAPPAASSDSVKRGGITAATSEGNDTDPNLDITFTVGSESNRVLLVMIVGGAGDNITPETYTVTWDQGGTNQSCTLIKYDTNSVRSRSANLFGLVAPTSGSNLTLRITSSSSNVNALARVAYYYNADQTGGTTTFPNSTSARGTSTAPEVSVSTTTRNMTVSVMGSPSGTGTVNTTLLWFTSGAGQQDGGASEGRGTSSVTHTWTIDSNPWVVVGTDIKAVP